LKEDASFLKKRSKRLLLSAGGKIPAMASMLGAAEK
jgi:hypothetical protein